MGSENIDLYRPTIREGSKLRSSRAYFVAVRKLARYFEDPNDLPSPSNLTLSKLIVELNETQAGPYMTTDHIP
jgi:hypothetical protein